MLWYRMVSRAGLYSLVPSAALSVFGGLVSLSQITGNQCSGVLGLHNSFDPKVSTAQMAAEKLTQQNLIPDSFGNCFLSLVALMKFLSVLL